MDQHDLAWAIDQALQEHERRTRRDRFIAAALTGIYANTAWPREWPRQHCAKAAILTADAVIAELDKERT